MAFFDPYQSKGGPLVELRVDDRFPEAVPQALEVGYQVHVSDCRVVQFAIVHARPSPWVVLLAYNQHLMLPGTWIS